MRKDMSHREHNGHRKWPYGRLALMAALSFIAMYCLMYAMVNTFADVYPNINQAYMAGLMTMPMVIIELGLMWAMYPRKKLNIVLMVIAVVLLGLFWGGVRQQTAVGDKEFIKSMIPHHSAAILMCEQTTLENVQLQALCADIKTNQQQEIDQMRTILEQE